MQALRPLCIYLKLSCSCSLYLLLIIFSYVFVHSIQLIICIKHYWYTMNKIPEIMITVNASQPQMIYSIPCCLHKIWIFFCCHTHPFLLHRCNLGIKIPPILWLVAVNCLYIVWRNYLAGVRFSCISRVSPVITIGVWIVRILPPQIVSPLLYVYYIAFILFCKE